MGAQIAPGTALRIQSAYPQCPDIAYNFGWKRS